MSLLHLPLKVAWITDYPIEWLPDLPEALRHLPRRHPRTWQQVLLQEFENNPAVELHILVLRRKVGGDVIFRKNGTTFYVLNVPSAVREQSLFWVDTLRLKGALAKIRPDIVHAWGSERGAHLVASRLPYPYLVTIQGLLTWYGELIPLNIYEKFAAFLERRYLGVAPLVTAESSSAVRYLTKHFPGLSVWQAEHAPNKVFQSTQRTPQIKPFRFLFVGHLGYRKGADLLVSALEVLAKEIAFKLVLIGEIEPNTRPLLQHFAARNPAIGVDFAGNLKASEIAHELSNCTMLLFPTRADTSPNAVKEAVVAGVPVIGSAIGGITDYVIPGKNGFTFPSENVPAFVAAIREACQHPYFSKGLVDQETLFKMRAYLAPERMSERFMQAYEILAKRRSFSTSASLINP